MYGASKKTRLHSTRDTMRQKEIKPQFLALKKLHAELVLWLFFTPFCFNTPCQYIPLLSLSSLISGLTPFGWLCSITLNPTYSIISYGNIFELRPFYLRPLFYELGRKTRILCRGRGKTHTGVWWETLQERAHLEDRGTDGRIKLRRILNRVGKRGL